SNIKPKVVSEKPRAYFLAFGFLFILVGISVPLSEKMFPQKFPPATQDQIFDEFTSSISFKDASLGAACLQETVSDHNLIASRGRALSPRYYESGEGEYTDKLGYKPSEQPRLLFYLTGDYYGLIILDLNQTPDFFPNASDVVVYRDKDNEHQAWFVLVRDDGRDEIYISDTFKPEISCFDSP
ncbi:MAG TPA: hypothetical protein VJ987_12410, partial [Anaerolineales bacterium]|nr:hypothetical protein [Anaerolineales bacterium]